MRKLLPVCLLLILIVVLLCGCAESFTYTYYLDNSGAVHMDYRFTYDASAEDAEIVKAEAERIVDKLVVGNDWKDISEVDTDTAGVVELRVTYPSLTDYEISSGTTGKEPNKIVAHENEGVLVKYTSTSEDYYSDRFVENVRSILGEGYETVSFSGCDFYYVYGTRYRTTKTNADSVEKRDGIYFHTWKLEPDTKQDIIVMQYGLNGILLYVITISVFVLSLAIISVIIVINNRRNKAVFRSVTSVSTEKTDGETGEEGE